MSAQQRIDDTQPIKAKRRPRSVWPFLALSVVLIIGLCILGAWLSREEIRTSRGGPAGSDSGSSSSSPEQSAWYACTTIIDRKFGVSFMDAQRYDASAVSGSGPYFMTVYYPDTNATFSCTVTRLASGDWSVVATH